MSTDKIWSFSCQFLKALISTSSRGFLLSNLRDITSISFRLGRSTRNITETSDIDAKSTGSHRRPQGEAAWGSSSPHWNLKMMTSYAVSVQNSTSYPYIESKTQKIVCAFGAPTKCIISSVLADSPPSGKIPACAHAVSCYSSQRGGGAILDNLLWAGEHPVKLVRACTGS